ncbi:MAG: ABC transporter permease [Candidatus Eisenbacteria bacterium]
MRWGDLRSDAAQALRALRRQPGFSLMAVLSLAVAIGVNATIFGLVDAILWKPLPGVRSAPLMSVFTSESDGNGFGVTSYPAFRDLRGHHDVFERVGAAALTPMRITEGDRSDRVLGMMVSGDWFGTLGVQAARGRVLHEADDRPEGPAAAVVLSDGFWRRRLAAAPDIVGRTVQLNGHAWEVVGVLPPSFRGVFMGFTPDVFVPTAMESWAAPGRSEMANRGGRSYTVYAQLARGLDLKQAQHRLDAIAAELGREYPASDSGRAFLVLPEVDSRPFPQAHTILAAFMALLLVITGLVLVIACVNLAGLLLARGRERRREIGVRLALGATRGRLIRMLVSESVVLGLTGGAAGLAIAYGGTRLLARFQPPLPVPVTIDLQPDVRVAVFSLVLGLVSAVMFALVPAWQSVSPSLAGALRDDASVGRSRFRSALMITQIALSMLLLASAGLFTRALSRAGALSPGFQPHGVTGVDFDPSLSGLDRAQTLGFYRDLLADLGAHPGVESVALAEHVPLSLGWSEAGMWLTAAEGQDPDRPLDQPVNAVSPGYFETLRIPLLRGRPLRMGQAQGEVVVNQSFAKRFWPGQEALGRRVSFDGPEGPWRTVVGLAADACYRSVGESPRPFVYLALDHDGDDDATLFVRSSLPAGELAAVLRSRIRALAPAMAGVQPRPLEYYIGGSLLPGRLAGGVLSATGVLALLLACLGLYAVVAYSVSRRTREIGVRVALGALPRDILGLVMNEGTRLLAWGAGIGMVLAIAAGFALRGLLYGLSPLDVPAYAGVLALLAVSTLIACWLPARRAVDVDPVVALRQE